MTLKLSKKVPSRKKTLAAKWCRKDFTVMDDTYRNIRKGSKRPMDACHWCKHKFENGEMMALACFDKIGNRTLCQACAAELLASESST